METKSTPSSLEHRSRYIPSWMLPQKISPPREVRYACGTVIRPGEFGMWDGPNPDERSMLENAGRTLNDVIIRYNIDHADDILWRWDGGGWTPIPSDTLSPLGSASY